METAVSVGVFVSIFVAILVAILFPLLGKQSKAEQEKARSRRMAEHKMNARLLKLNI